MPVLWQEAMSVGNKHIDDEHKYLFCLINSVEVALKLDDNQSIMKFLFAQLEQYTSSHFRQEEAIQLQIKYPNYLEHKLQHQEILDNIAELKQKFFSANKQDKVEYQQKIAATADADPTGAKQAFDPEDLDLVLEPVVKGNDALEHDMVVLLRSWILDHVLQTDMKMRKYLAKLPNSSGSKSAR